MARNLKLFFDRDGSPRARGPASEKILMAFLETDVQGSDHLCHDLMEDLTAVEDGTAESREFIGNAHAVTISSEGVVIDCVAAQDALQADDTQVDDSTKLTLNQHTSEGQTTDTPGAAAYGEPGETAREIQYTTGLKHFREVLEDWEAFILDDQSPA